MEEFIEELERLLQTARELNDKMVTIGMQNNHLKYVKSYLEQENADLQQENQDLIEELKDREREILDCEAELRDCVVSGDCNVYR